MFRPLTTRIRRTPRLVSGLLTVALAVSLSVVTSPVAAASAAPVGQGFTVTPADLAFILKQIKIAERHSRAFLGTDPSIAANPNPTGDPNYCQSLVGPGKDQIPDRLTSYGLRTVDGSCNNLFPGRESYAAADLPFPRLTSAIFRSAEKITAEFPVGAPGPTSYAQKSGSVVDTQPRLISNLIVDQTSNNPAAVAAAAFPVRTQNNPGTFPCTTDPDLISNPPVDAAPAGCVPSGQTLDIPNVTTDVGLSPPYNSLFTYFGQFFDHGIDQTVKGGGTVFVPLRADDPLIAGADKKFGTGDDLSPSLRFMVLTRAKNQPGPDGKSGTADDQTDALNTDSPWIDQSQTYSSHASHQAFLREYAIAAGTDGATGTADDRPVPTGRLLGGLDAGLTYAGSPDGRTGISTWAAVKEQAASMMGLLLTDADVTNIPMLAMDPYGNFVPGARGLPQYVTASGLVEGNRDNPVPVPADVRYFNTPFLTDIAHNADPTPVDTDRNPSTPPVAPRPDDDTTASADFTKQPAGTYDNEMLDAHFACGDGRCNENIALSAIHQVFHSEHDRLVEDIKSVLTKDTSTAGKAALTEWALPTNDSPDGWNGSRLFQAARFITEMEYQHAVFEDFGRKVQPAIRAFRVYSPDIQPAVDAEFAHAVYRFGHSMLNDSVARTNVSTTGAKTDNSLPLLTAFLNPPEYYDGGAAGTLTPAQAAGSIMMGSSDQIGNELDEFVTETLRNNLLGLPLDLATLNLARARDAGVPPLNEFRRQLAAQTNDGQLAPYTSWSDFGQHLRHPESLINFVAAYGTHPTIRDSGPDGVPGNADDVTTAAAKRAAAKLIVDPASGTDPATVPADAADFMFSSGTWASSPAGVTTTGLDDVDLWIGGLAEVTNLFGGLLGTTFNYVFQNQMEKLQDGDRLYYLARTPGLNLRTQLEGNSFAELVQRNTDNTDSLKADAFAVADCRFQLGNLTSPAAAGSFITGTGSVNDDPSTPDCNENRLLLKSPNGTISYRTTNSVDRPGINGQAVYNGTTVADRVNGGNDNDTFWGGPGNDVIEGNGGDDVALGGEGNDILTDLGGDDFSKGGPGNDAVDAGIGFDILVGGDGQDVLNGGANDNQVFGGPDNDFIIGGTGADAVFGDGGDDWIQGGTGQDLLQGDHGAPFFDDPAQTAPGNDIFVGQAGENDYDAEGGDDLMAQNAAIDRNAGAGGFDWAFHQYDTTPADDDMEINNNLAGLALQVVTNRDRWQETEAVSGGALDDVIKGTSVAPKTLGGGGFTGCDAIDAAGVARIKNLDQLITSFPSDLAPIVASSAPGACPLEGPTVWGEGDVLIGGAGSDTFTGRGADDIIDGDRYLQVRISVRTNPADPATELGTTDLLEGRALSGNFGPGTTATTTLQQAVFAGLVDPARLVATRTILTAPALPADCGATAPKNCDTAVFQGPSDNYSVAAGTVPGQVVVTQIGANLPGQRSNDGVDTLTNIERLRFADIDQVLTLPTAPTVGTATFTTNGVDATATVTFTAEATQPALTGFLIRAVPVGSVPGGSDTLVGTPITDGTATSGVIENLPLGQSFQLQVAATNPLGMSAFSALSNVITPRLLPAIALTRPAAFPNTVVGVTSAAQTFALTNIGQGELTPQFAIVGATPSSFAVDTSSCPATLAAGTSCDLRATFTPTGAGFRGTTFTVSAAGVTGVAARSIGLTGNGVTAPLPAAALTGIGAFGDAVIGTTSAPQTLTLANTGGGTLAVSAVDVTGPDATSFVLDRTGCGATVAGNSSCTLTVTFSPTAIGSKAAAVTVTDNAAGSPHTVALTGTGLPVPLPVVTLSAPAAFADTTVGTISAPQTLTVANAGPGTATLSDVVITGDTSFTLDRTGCAATVAAGASCPLVIRFAPTTAGQKTATLTVTDSGAGSPHTVTLTGTGTAVPLPVVTLSGATAFPNTTVGTTSAPQTLTVANAGPGTATLSDIVITGDTSFTLDRTGCAATVAAGASCPLVIRFAPTTAGQKTATLTVTDTGAGSPRSVTLTGTGTAVPPTPTVTTRTPAAGATGINATADVAATFDVAVTGVSATTFTLRQGTTAVPAVVTQVGGTNQWLLNPNATLAASTVYTVTVTGGADAIRSADGVALTTVSWTFTTAAPADTTPPTVTTRSPDTAATAIPVGSSVTAVFSEPLNAATVTAANVSLRQGTATTGTLIAAAVTYDAATRTLTLDPNANLAVDTRYTVRLGTGVRDVAGNALAAVSWSFLTGPAPTVITLNPAVNATAFPVADNLTGTFSEAVAGVSGTTVTLRAGTAATGALVPAAVTYNAATRVVTLNPNANLTPDTRYTVRISSGITDLAGNPVTTASSTFLTGPAPSVTARTPGVNATGVSRTANITATFSEAVVAARLTGTTVTLRTAAAGTLIPAVVTYNATTRVVTLNPNATLAANTRYTVRLDPTITDAAGNPLPVTTWTFTTGG